MPDRLDRTLAARGLARSRTEAAQLIAAGEVQVNGRPAQKPSQPVTDADQLTITAGERWVSRAAHKLLHALDQYAIDVTDRVALDLGASTGGFTQVLLQRGAAHVIALDVGHDQLDVRLRADPRVTVIEGENARYLTEQRLAELAPGRQPSLVVGDLSFISLRHILPAAHASCPHASDLVLLFKPQFEVGRAFVRGGLVADTAAAADAADGVLADAAALGLGLAGACRSPIAGTHGNREYLLWFRPGHGAPADAVAALRRMVAKGEL